MGTFLSVVGLALAALFAVLLLKQSSLPPLAVLLSLGVGALILLRLLPLLGEIITVFRRLAEESGLSQLYLSVILKIIAVSYVAEFAAGLCRDAGESALATKIELAGKVVVIVLAVPIIVNILDSVVSILP
jgi:stage III sporulation protein AD